VAIETASSTRATGIHDQWGWPSRPMDDVRAARLVTTKNATTATVTAVNPPRMPFRNSRRSAPWASPQLRVAGTGTVVSVIEAIESELGAAITVSCRADEGFDRSSLPDSRLGTSSNASVRGRIGDSRGLHWTPLLTVDMSAS
jgi:hypothetical protein